MINIGVLLMFFSETERLLNFKTFHAIVITIIIIVVSLTSQNSLSLNIIIIVYVTA